MTNKPSSSIDVIGVMLVGDLLRDQQQQPPQIAPPVILAPPSPADLAARERARRQEKWDNGPGLVLSLIGFAILGALLLWGQMLRHGG